jgi:hypothetical protein
LEKLQVGKGVRAKDGKRGRAKDGKRGRVKQEEWLEVGKVGKG